MSPKYQLVYDGRCPLCQRSVRWLKRFDRSARIRCLDYHDIPDLHDIHPFLTLQEAQSRVQLVVDATVLYSGFPAVRRLAAAVPLLWPLIPLLWFPGAAVLGPRLYAWVARNRHQWACSAPGPRDGSPCHFC